ncbi:PD-(D/E)XK nuclease family protein [Schaalia sp. 19OD2882]|uniref:RecB family exonuclease n=1 Tax=Schaalia sp. 19OD2882 TaxID=2794089 RepID=UPI001C1EAACC|nr:PD-(D/E)XK nuclease family protein [Schaalia sp. 19OD2882]QWW18726.1 PD-(D/E)XK nuclease family protein [Schaalia sp. 19OD2882]
MTTRTWLPALSASRAKEYERCPLQYRLHVVDGVKEPPTRATTMGTLIHSALEGLFDAPAALRQAEYALTLLDAAWKTTVERDPAVLDLFDDEADRQQWWKQVREVLTQYFGVEDPRWLEPVAREHRIDVVTEQGLRLRGIVDRVDRSPAGDLRVVDYKTGRAPSPRYTEEALFQMRFYALLLDLADRLPRRMQLLYLRSGQVLTLDPQPQDIRSFADRIEQLWQRIESDARRGHFEARKNPLCNWCGVRAMCPLFDGVTPDLPEEGVAKLLATRVSA